MKSQHFDPSITKRVRKRTTRTGKIVRQTRFVLNYRCPDTQRRTQRFFACRDEAEVAHRALVDDLGDGRYIHPDHVPTIAEIMTHWLEARRTEVKPSTFSAYEGVVKLIVGPVLEGTRAERCDFAVTGKKPHRNARLLRMLGPVPVNELTNAAIRRWHGVVKAQIGRYSANRALSMLKSALSLCEEDYGTRAPAMPTHLGRRRSRSKKAMLTSSQVGHLIEHARHDHDRGIYYVFPFLAGTRLSEQLGLLWDDIGFDTGLIHIRRIQERDGSLTECTKTEAGRRSIPMSPTLRTMLMRWKLTCPRRDGKLHRVFPGPGRLQPWPPVFAWLDLPYITPHAARHQFISTLQAQGVEVGLVAKLVGHANPTVTLGHYTQAVRGGEEAVRALEDAYAG